MAEIKVLTKESRAIGPYRLSMKARRQGMIGPYGFLQKFICPGRNYISPPCPPPFLAKRHFPGEGGGGVYFEAPRGRNLIRPPPPFYTPPTPRRVFGRVGGGWGCIKIGPVIWTNGSRISLKVLVYTGIGP